MCHIICWRQVSPVPFTCTWKGDSHERGAGDTCKLYPSHVLQLHWRLEMWHTTNGHSEARASVVRCRVGPEDHSRASLLGTDMIVSFFPVCGHYRVATFCKTYRQIKIWIWHSLQKPEGFSFHWKRNLWLDYFALKGPRLSVQAGDMLALVYCGPWTTGRVSSPRFTPSPDLKGLHFTMNND